MTQTAARPQQEHGTAPQLTEELDGLMDRRERRGKVLAELRLVWSGRLFVFRFACVGFVCATLTAFLIPKRYVSTAQLMPPDSQSNNLALVSAFAGQSSSLGSLAGDMFGL